MTGEAAPYCLVGDSTLMLLFVLNLTGMAYVFLMNGSSILELAKSMFYHGKQSNPYNDRTHITTICNLLLYWQTIFYASIAVFGYLQYGQRTSTGNTPCFLITMLMLLFTVMLPIKRLMFDICNKILFSDQQAREWRQSYFFTIKLMGLVLFPAVLCLIFIKDFPNKFYTAYIIFATIIYLFVFINRAINTIFREKRNYLDIFLYLCALELLPMAILWRLIQTINEFLITKI